MKNFIFWLKIHWILFLGFNKQNFIIGPDIGLAPNRRQAIILNNANLIHWRIYAELEGDRLKHVI